MHFHPCLKGIRHVAFDCDGVLFDTVNLKVRAYEEVFAAYGGAGLGRFARDLLVVHFGRPRTWFLEKIGDEARTRGLSLSNAGELAATLDARVAELLPTVVPTDGALTLVAALARSGVSAGVISGAPADEVLKLVVGAGFQIARADIHGSVSDKTLQLQCELTVRSLRSDQLLFIGDAPVDARAAAQAGVPFVWRKSVIDFPADLTKFCPLRVAALSELFEQ